MNPHDISMKSHEKYQEIPWKIPIDRLEQPSQPGVLATLVGLMWPWTDFGRKVPWATNCWVAMDQ